MWYDLKRQLLFAVLAASALACAFVLSSEAQRKQRAETWAQLSAGLGCGSRAGVAAGFFAYDARLESLPDGVFAPLPGFCVDDGPAGVFTFPSR